MKKSENVTQKSTGDTNAGSRDGTGTGVDIVVDEDDSTGGIRSLNDNINKTHVVEWTDIELSDIKVCINNKD